MPSLLPHQQCRPYHQLILLQLLVLGVRCSLHIYFFLQSFLSFLTVFEDTRVNCLTSIFLAFIYFLHTFPMSKRCWHTTKTSRLSILERWCCLHLDNWMKLHLQSIILELLNCLIPKVQKIKNWNSISFYFFWLQGRQSDILLGQQLQSYPRIKLKIKTYQNREVIVDKLLRIVLTHC